MFYCKPYDVIGVMSGTSLDGMDIALCRFGCIAGHWRYRITEARTYPYTPDWRNTLAQAHTLDAAAFAKLNMDYGILIGETINAFCTETGRKADLVASHGHTVFHQPLQGLTWQAGDVTAIAATCGIPTIADFRKLDVMYGGQGAPLVPMGDEKLFAGYDALLNLGGFANLSFRENRRRMAFDICPVNILLNRLAGELGMDYDKNGELAAAGQVILPLLKNMNDLPFYRLSGPKSLSREWFETSIWPLISENTQSVQDKLRTCTEHIVAQLAAVLNSRPFKKILITGGGAYNRFLMNRLQQAAIPEIILPSPQIIEFKEALIFAFLGLLRYLKQPNTITSVTGAKKNGSGGILALP